MEWPDKSIGFLGGKKSILGTQVVIVRNQNKGEEMNRTPSELTCTLLWLLQIYTIVCGFIKQDLNLLQLQFCNSSKIHHISNQPCHANKFSVMQREGEKHVTSSFKLFLKLQSHNLILCLHIPDLCTIYSRVSLMTSLKICA